MPERTRFDSKIENGASGRRGEGRGMEVIITSLPHDQFEAKKALFLDLGILSICV